MRPLLLLSLNFADSDLTQAPAEHHPPRPPPHPAPLGSDTQGARLATPAPSPNRQALGLGWLLHLASPGLRGEKPFDVCLERGRLTLAPCAKFSWSDGPTGDQRGAGETRCHRRRRAGTEQGHHGTSGRQRALEGRGPEPSLPRPRLLSGSHATWPCAMAHFSGGWLASFSGGRSLPGGSAGGHSTPGEPGARI